MKPELIFTFIILLLSIFIKSDKSQYNQKRYLQISQASKPLLLLGFEDYDEGTIKSYHSGYIYSVTMTPVFMKYNDSINIGDFNITMRYRVKYDDGKTQEEENKIFKSKCDQFENQYGFLEGICHIDLVLDRNGTIISGEILEFPGEINKIPVEISYPAEKLMKNIKNAPKEDMVIFMLQLMNIVINENKIISLQGNISSPTGQPLTEKTVNLTLNNTEYNCNISNISAYTQEISFLPKTSLNVSLDHKVMDLDGKGRIILIFINGTNNSRIEYITDWDKDKGNHTKSENHFIDLLGIQNYKEKEDGKATGKAYFKGDLDSLYTLRKFMKVNALVKPTQKRLRYLDEEKTTNITGIGTRNDTITNGEITYDIEYNKTKDQEIIMFFNDFEFSDNETFPPSETIKANQMNISTDLADPYSITKSDPLVIKFMNLTNIDKNQSGSHLTFEFEPGNELGTITKTNGTVNYIPIINNSNSEREEMNCTYERNNTIHKLICEPGKNIKTNTNTWRINIWKAQNNNSLRNLQEVGNTTFFLDKSKSNDNLIEYTLPEKRNPPVRKKKKGLSAGAIVAIVLATVAVVAAVIVALLLLKTGPKPPIEADKISIPNSSTNINH